MQARTIHLLIVIASALAGVGVCATVFGDWLGPNDKEDLDKSSVKTIVMLLGGGELLDPDQAKQCRGHVFTVIQDTSAQAPASCFIGCLPGGNGRAACCPLRTVYVPPTSSDPLGDCVYGANGVVG